MGGTALWRHITAFFFKGRETLRGHYTTIISDEYDRVQSYHVTVSLYWIHSYILSWKKKKFIHSILILLTIIYVRLWVLISLQMGKGNDFVILMIRSVVNDNDTQ
jgi:hypothetical protein